MEYNTDRSRLIIPEYGRNVQKMIGYCLSLEDRDERNETAMAIIEVMGNLNPHLRDVPDFKHKLWDQLFIMSDFKLDVDTPYPIPSKEFFSKPPEMIPYPQKSRKYRFYGINLRHMIDEAISREDGPEKQALIRLLANHMKKSFLNWNKDVVDDKTIFKHLYEISEGKIDLRDGSLVLAPSSVLIHKKKPFIVDSSNSKGKTNTNNYGRSNYHTNHHNNQNRGRK